MDNRYHLVCNGEIYNSLDLKLEWKAEAMSSKQKLMYVILPLFQFYGVDGFSQLDGMFSQGLFLSKYFVSSVVIGME